MKKYIITLLAVLCLASCGPITRNVAFKQVAQTKSSESSMVHYDKTLNAYLYEDKNIKIVYDFWKEGGSSYCTIYNKTDKILYVDLDKSFLVKNSISYLYYYPIYTKIDDGYKANLSCLPIAPKATKTLSGQNFGYTQYMDCDFSIKPDKNKPVSIFFDETTSPAVFRAILAYRIGENDTERFVSNNFFISSITNYRSSDILVKKEIRDTPLCPNKNNGTAITTPNVINKTIHQKYIYSPSTGFYVNYTQEITE